MKTVCSPWGIVSYEFPNQGLMDIKGGFDNIVLNVGGIVGYHAYHNLHWRKKRGGQVLPAMGHGSSDRGL